VSDQAAYYFDQKAADAAVDFFQRRLRFTEGEWAGQPFILQDWQEHDIIRPLFGWKRTVDGTRRYRRCYVWVPRKNGKTELAAGVALLALLGDGEDGGQVFSIAMEKDQASIVFNKASNMVHRAVWLQTAPPDGPGLSTLKESIYCSLLNASFRPLSGKPKGKHGLNMSGLVGDEIHEWPTGELYTFVHDSAAARRQPIEFLISTAGTKGSHGEEVWDECQAILSGDIEDPETLVVVYAAGPDDDWTKPEVWKKANPNYGVSVKADAFEAAFRRARQLPRLENDFKRYRLNLWTDQAVRWLPIDAVDDEGRRFGWDHCAGPIGWKALEANLRHKTCFGGLDLSAVIDLSALIWWFPIQDDLPVPVVLARFFKPAGLVKLHAKRDRLPYERWVKEGALITTPGTVVDYAFIQEQIYRDAENFRIGSSGYQKLEPGQGGLAIDRWNATETAVKLQQEGLPVVLFGQGFASMSAPSKELERLVLGNGFHHGQHPLLRKHAQAVAVETDAAGNIKPAKHKSAMRIDGIVALIMALGIAARQEPPVNLDEWLANPVMIG
jgi:phage terminase large subunit-like protein